MPASQESTLERSPRRVAQAHATREVNRVRDVLHARYAKRLPTSEVDHVIDRLAPTFLANPVLDYVGVLVERAARRELDLMATPPTS
jgi:hypothetical protein